MEVRVLGCSGGIGGNHLHTTSLLVDSDVLIDCGTGLGTLELEKLSLIDHIFLTHAHLDHVALLPLLIDTVYDMRAKPITLYALEETIHSLRQHIFNWSVWPDFSAIPDKEAPILQLQPVVVGQQITLKGRTFTPIPAQHSVPTVGYCITEEGRSLILSGDTTFSDTVIDAINAVKNLKYLIIENAFPETHRMLAVRAQHMSSSMLHDLLGKLTGDPIVLIAHLKPGHLQVLPKEILSYQGRLSLELLEGQRVISL